MVKELGKSAALFLRGLGHHFAWLVLGAIPGIVDLVERETGKGIAVPNSVFWGVFAAGTLVAAVFAYHDLRMATAGGSAAMDIRHIKDELAYLFRRLDELEEGELEAVYHDSFRQPYTVLPTQAWNNRGPNLEEALGENYETVRDAFIDVDRFNRLVMRGQGGDWDPDPDIDALRRTLKHAESLMP